MLLAPEQAAGFLLAAGVITLVPGPDNLMVLSLGAARGRRAGLLFGLGCACGCLSHALLAALGVSVLVAATPWAFFALKLCGGGYLVWLGLRLLTAPKPGIRRPDHPSPADRDPVLFVRGLLAAGINPKVILFFLAFLPQFVWASRGPVWLQMGQLGVLFALQVAILFGAIGLAAGWVGERLSRHPGLGVWLDRLAGTLFVALGLKLVVLT